MFISRFWFKNIHLVRIYVKTIRFGPFFLFFVTEFYLSALYLEK